MTSRTKKTQTPAGPTAHEKFELIATHTYDFRSDLFEAANAADVNGRHTADEKVGPFSPTNADRWTELYEEFTVATWDMLVDQKEASPIY